jgi:hypothetical protein
MFTCYEAIEAGMISQALCDLSNGASETIVLKDSKGELVDSDAIWTRLIDSAASGYLIGAGSNTGSDTNMVAGIAQGHAYMVVRVYTDPDRTQRLIQLQNPHGHGEWEGDWSDSSPLWTQKWRNLLHQPTEDGTVADAKNDVLDDGKFWMNFHDFQLAYENLYVCRLLPKRQVLHAAWRGHTAMGAGAPWHNPHFTISSSKCQKVYIELEQESNRGKKTAAGEDGSKGEQVQYAFILFIVLRLDGTATRLARIHKPDVLACSNAWNFKSDRQISCEFFIAEPDTMYTIVALGKAKVEREFTMSVFSADDSVNFKMVDEQEQPM